MDANITLHHNNVALDFESFAASDTRICMLLNADGTVIAVNPASKRAMPEIIPGSDLNNYITDPADFRRYLHQCAKTRGPLPGALSLRDSNQGARSWICEGGLAKRTPDGHAALVLRLQGAELGKSAFATLNAKIV